ncbi:MAG: methionine biosynthesis protein MetW [Thermoleophilia bacterium]|nr:methionine biosynthesis protein MetW [Thermoleophilia bacterium]
MALRPDLDVVAAMVARGSRVLDLGCGDGALLAHLIRDKGCDGTGVEISDDGFHACVARGVPVMVADIDHGLSGVDDGAFDVVILSQTLQATHRPALVLHEMMRVGRVGIVSFPNFGYWRLRWSLAARGRMPTSRSLPYQWYDTPNIHLCTIRDFETLLAREELMTQQRVLLDERGGPAQGIVRYRPNLLGAGAVYLVGR